MAKVIRGVFPETAAAAKKRDDKPLVSYVLHISIMFSDPLIWRRIQVPGEYTLAGLHEVIQRVMGWSDSHVHQFLVGKISYEPTMHSVISVREAKRFDEHFYQLHDLAEGMQFMFTYLYDAGDGWEHQIHLEEVVPPDKPLRRPILLSGEGACPPETVGDIHHYQTLLATRKKTGDKQNDPLAELAGRPDFDPAGFDLQAAKKRLATLS